MKIGVYKRKGDNKLPTKDWLINNKFDAFRIYEENVLSEYDDISERVKLNTLIYEAKEGKIDAVYVADLQVFSKITVKLLQCIIEIQKINLPVYHNNGCILPSDEKIKQFQDQMISQWEKIEQNSAKFKDINH
ncbi:hypothetical protein [Daejeonella sp.]|jgi:DNA invertase Pin-like site-specific DNA recombinase|uniref:hypothetical protein n=1 Tax=Daejeonella sp. TaxID=2805397 RepID=UPI0037BFCAA0